LLCAPEYDVELAFQQRESLLEIVAVRRRPSAGRNVHVDQTKPASRFLAAEQNRVGIPYDSNVGDFLLGVRPCRRKLA
jgi:hypothetical protein